MNAYHTIISYEEIKQKNFVDKKNIYRIYISSNVVVMIWFLKYTQNKVQGGRLSCLDIKRTPVAGDNNKFQNQESLL